MLSRELASSTSIRVKTFFCLRGKFGFEAGVGPLSPIKILKENYKNRLGYGMSLHLPKMHENKRFDSK